MSHECLLNLMYCCFWFRFWGIKFLVLFVLCGWSFWVECPKFAEGTVWLSAWKFVVTVVESLKNLTHHYLLVWMYIGLVGGLLFIVIQLMLLVDFAHTWNEIWYESVHNIFWLKWFQHTYLKFHVVAMNLVLPYQSYTLYHVFYSHWFPDRI